MTELPAIDPFDPRHVHDARGLLADFNGAHVLAAVDVHVARRLGALLDEADEHVLLAAALAVRAPRLGHVYTDLATVAASVVVDAEPELDLAQLPWPEPAAWGQAVAASPLSVTGEQDETVAPLRLVGTRLYLDRHWRQERRLAADLAALAVPVAGVDEAVLADGLARLFAATGGGTPDDAGTGGGLAEGGPGGSDDAQARAAGTAVRRRLSVVAGGPGTGKTTTVARIVALLAEQAAAAGRPHPRVALAAPTGKAAARLQEAVRAEGAQLATAPEITAAITGLGASTLHRLLGWHPDRAQRFRHHRRNRLPHDVVIVDESSMISLALMADLVEAVRPDARLILVGDPDQLTSIEAGAVLGDLVGPDVEADAAPTSAARPPASGVAAGVTVLEQVHRYGPEIDAVARAVRAGDGEATLAALRDGGQVVTWHEVDVGDPGATAPVAVRDAAVAAGTAMLAAAQRGDAPAALAALGSFRLLCAHRRGPAGAAHWMAVVEGWLGAGRPGERWYAGRPLLVTENDPVLGLANGDTGVVVDDGSAEPVAVFERGSTPWTVSPHRLRAVDTVYAMTIHKAQGSQFPTAAVLLPAAASPLLTRELLYTGVTRARERLIVVGDEAAIRRAVERPAARASGLRARLEPG